MSEFKNEYQEAYESMIEVNASKDRRIQELIKRAEKSNSKISDYRLIVLLISPYESGHGGNWGLILKEYITSQGIFSPDYSEIINYEALANLVREQYGTQNLPSQLIKEIKQRTPFIFDVLPRFWIYEQRRIPPNGKGKHY